MTEREGFTGDEGPPRIEIRRIEPRFELGRIAATSAALDVLDLAGVATGDLLRRHVTGDWGNVPPEDAEENEYSVAHGLRVMSSYPIGEEEQEVWVITERGRWQTTLLLPIEY